LSSKVERAVAGFISLESIFVFTLTKCGEVGLKTVAVHQYSKMSFWFQHKH